MENKSVAFRGAIKLISVKTLESADLSVEISFRVDNLKTEVLNKINELQSSRFNKSKELLIYISDKQG